VVVAVVVVATEVGEGGSEDHHCYGHCHCTAAVAVITHVHSPCQVASCLALPLKAP